MKELSVELLAKVKRLDGPNCGAGSCPAFMKTNRESYIVVGLKLTDADRATIDSPKVNDVHIADDEEAVEIPVALFNAIKNA